VRALVLTSLTLLLAHCRTNDLVPSPSAIAVVGREVTPLYLEIDNGGELPLRVRYSEFALIARDGQRFAALPPLAVEGEGRLKSIRPFRHPRFTYRDFALAPWYRTVYPGHRLYTPFAVDPFYYDTYFRYWDARAELPTPAMIDRALPEGVVMPRGLVQGWLYLEELDHGVAHVALRTDLVDARDAAGYGELRIPFEVR
jgi:hypothetical protein